MSLTLFPSTALSLFAAIFPVDERCEGINVEEAMKIEIQMDRDYATLEKLGTYKIKPYKARRQTAINGEMWDAAGYGNGLVTLIIPLGSIVYARVDLDLNQVDIELLGNPVADSQIITTSVSYWRGIRPNFHKLKDNKVYASKEEEEAGLAVRRNT